MMSGGYTAPRTLDEAITLLANTPGARVLAGGHGLLVEPHRSRTAQALLVDLRHIQGLAGIERQRDGRLKIGAMTTLATLVGSEVIRAAYPALVEAARVTGDAQLRNRATLGGSLASGDPEADLPALALALDASIHVTGPKGERVLRADELFTGGPDRALGSADVITAVTIPSPADRSGAAYQTVRHPATLQAICGIAAQVTLAQDGTVTATRVAVTGATAHAARLHAVEKALLNTRPDTAALAAAAGAAGQDMTFRSDLFASAEYRHHLARVLSERALKQAVERAGVRVS